MHGRKEHNLADPWQPSTLPSTIGSEPRPMVSTSARYRPRRQQNEKLRAVLASLGATARAWALKESFRKFWTYRSETWAAAWLKAWTTRAMRSQLEPMKKVARMLRRHEDLLLNYFRARRRFTNAVTEGMNHKARVALARSFGHRSFEVLKLVLYHTLGHLPEPPQSHKFC